MRTALAIMVISFAPLGCGDPAATPSSPAPTSSAPVTVPPIEGELAQSYRLIQQGDAGPARIRIRKWMEANGEDARAMFLFGLAYHHERRYAMSSTWFTRALDATPTYPPAAHFLGWSAYYLGDSDASRNAFMLHVNMSPDEGDSHYGLGLLALDAGELEAARASFMRSIELQRLHEDRADGVSKALVRIAELDELQDNRRGARSHLEQAVAVDPDRIEGWHRLARCCRRLGDHDAAAEAERQYAIALERVQPRGGFPE
ncbi:MAG: tetratricopeptide repeat protein [Phycisphaerales bacterium]|nr:tetratricopeptide repeat protein [Phycisphaerales bacterium]